MNEINRQCPVASLPMDEKEVKEREQIYKDTWGDILSKEEADIKYAWFDAVHTMYENKIVKK